MTATDRKTAQKIIAAIRAASDPNEARALRQQLLRLVSLSKR